MWVFEYYFNNNNKHYNYDKISLWYYEYNKSPLLKDIYRFMRKIENYGLLYQNLSSKYINRSEYLKPLQYYIFITPINNLYNNFENNNLLKIIENNKDKFIDISEIINEINQNNEKNIDINIIKKNEYINKIINNIKNLNINDFLVIFNNIKENDFPIDYNKYNFIHKISN